MTIVTRTRGYRIGMEERNALRVRSYLVAGLMLSSIYVSIGAQIPGFLSIDCGASPYKDTLTSLPWESDSPYTSTGSSGQVPFSVNANLDNSEALTTFTYFPDVRKKHCYDLPTSANVTFLLRAMFLHGSAAELALPIAFDVAVNGTTWFTVKYAVDASFDNLTNPLEYEGIFFSAGNLTHFCLVTNTGVPFISSLELRELDPDGIMYSYNSANVVDTIAAGQYLSNLRRFNCGAKIGSASVRYPDDMYDRLWKAPGSWSSNLNSSTSVGVVDSTTNSFANAVPSIVMQDAWEYSNPTDVFSILFSEFGNEVPAVYAAVYYEEIISSAQPGDRLISIAMNGVAANETATNFTRMLYYWNWDVSPLFSTNFSFAAQPGSVLGPIVNAVEVYAQLSFDASATAINDVNALAAVQVSFNLTNWQGDPCYPVPWDWVDCTSDTTARVDKLMLSRMGILASIPQSISQLDALTEIHLDHNNLYGSIPESLASIPNLIFLFLNDNNLSGGVPSVLVTKLGTDFDYSGNSLLNASSVTPASTKKSSNLGVIVGVVAGVVLGLGIVIGILLRCFYLKKKRRNHLQNGEIAIAEKQTSSRPTPLRNASDFDTSVSKPPLVLNSAEVGRVSYETVKIATRNFSVEIGQGSYGSVFHGWLDNREVAVKLNNVQSQQGRHEFITEVEILTRVHHRNLVSLIAYCDEGKELILIYEYQANGTLQDWLHDEGQSRGTLDWKLRLQIAADVAKGLEYLHKGCDPTIIHRDVKPNNILLDDNMAAKVADFGLSKSTPGENTVGYSTGVKGTPRYLDPEYHHLGRLTYKSDVYSFGVVLAEIITGLPPFSVHSTGKSPVVLVDRVRKLVERNDIQALADPNLQGMYSPESMWRMADVALSCIAPIAANRPDFTQVVSDINEAIGLEKSFSVHSPFHSRSRSFVLRSNSSSYQTLQ